MNGFQEKCEKPPFFVIFDQKGQFWTVFGQNGENDQKSAWNIFTNFFTPNFI